jgi:hypothetical protein
VVQKGQQIYITSKSATQKKPHHYYIFHYFSLILQRILPQHYYNKNFCLLSHPYKNEKDTQAFTAFFYAHLYVWTKHNWPTQCG